MPAPPPDGAGSCGRGRCCWRCPRRARADRGSSPAAVLRDLHVMPVTSAPRRGSRRRDRPGAPARAAGPGRLGRRRCRGRCRGCRRAGGFDAAGLPVAALRQSWPTRHAACAPTSPGRRPVRCAWRSASTMPGHRASGGGQVVWCGGRHVRERQPVAQGGRLRRGPGTWGRLTGGAPSSNGTAPLRTSLQMFK